MNEKQEAKSESGRSGATSKVWNYVAMAMVLVGLAFSLTMAFASDGLYQDDDSCHYMFAVHAWDNGVSMWYQWARPGYNIPAMVAAKLGGFTGCRIFSALQTALTAFLVWRIALRAGISPRAAAIAPLLLWFQPLVMMLSYTTLTETPVMLYMTAAVLLYMRGNMFWSCVMMGLCFVTRQETMAMAPVLGGAIIVDALRKNGWKIVAAMRTAEFWTPFVMLWALIVHIIAAVCVGLTSGEGSPLGIFSTKYTDEYGSGSLYHYLLFWPEAAAMGVLLLALVGIFSLSRKGWIVWAITLWMFAVQSIVFWKGMFASGGYGRFMLSVSGLVAVLAAGGLSSLWRGRNEWMVFVPLALLPFWVLLILTKFPWLLHGVDAREMYKAAAIVTIPPAVVGLIVAKAKLHWVGKWAAVILIGLAAAQGLTQIRPLRLSAEPVHAALANAADFIRNSEYADNPVMSQHTVAEYLLCPQVKGLSGNQPAIDAWNAATPGTVFIWENKYCYKDRNQKEIDSTEELLVLLNGFGRLVWQQSSPGAMVLVFVKKSATSYQELYDDLMRAGAATSTRPAELN